ncbi:sn-1-specific diacylglycerol lipase ABHD11-like isoform X3 [Babylonia areolata]|uniref:sn-1-specific diacylglycerol lipase ABHD11-like isoform X3 n=1 Tax=Babylonia areolata TaxID=304850 RepID=UPI003FD5676E
MNQHIRHSFLCLAKRCNFRYTFRAFSFSSRHYKVKISYEVYPQDIRLELAQEPPIFILHGMFGSKLNWHSLAKRISSVTHRQPERVSSLIVVDTAPKDSPGSDALKVYAQKMKEIPLPSPSTSMPEARREVGNKLKAFVEEESVRLFLLTNLKQSMDNSYFWRVNLDAIIKNFESLHSFPQINEPCSINTIFIGGAESKHVDSTAEPAIHRLFPGTAIERIPQAGHWVHSEKPSEFVELVQKFVLS